jgi:protoheme IX farnesyltransferase
MKTATAVYPASVSLTSTRLADYVELCKPRIAVMALLTVAAGAWMASAGSPDWRILGHTLLGAAMVAAGSSALNQLLERDSDALMQRTENRPLPAGRLSALEVFCFGASMGLAGIAYLALVLPSSLAAGVAALIFVSYVFVYTPLKRKTSLNTLIGAVPGALPPVIGWAAVRGSIGPEIMTVFAIMFLWQVPHFLAIAWIYREDYRRAGLCMLSGADTDGSMSGRQMIAYCLALIPVSLTPLVIGQAGPVYLAGALLLGLGFLASAWAFSRRHTSQRARGVLKTSLVYLPAILGLLLIDGGMR